MRRKIVITAFIALLLGVGLTGPYFARNARLAAMGGKTVNKAVEKEPSQEDLSKLWPAFVMKPDKKYKLQFREVRTYQPFHSVRRDTIGEIKLIETNL